MKRTAAEAANFPEAVWRAWWEREEAKRDGRPRMIFGGFDGKYFTYHAVWFPPPVDVISRFRSEMLREWRPIPGAVFDPLVLPGQEKLPGI